MSYYHIHQVKPTIMQNLSLIFLLLMPVFENQDLKSLKQLKSSSVMDYRVTQWNSFLLELFLFKPPLVTKIRSARLFHHCAKFAFRKLSSSFDIVVFMWLNGESSVQKLFPTRFTVRHICILLLYNHMAGTTILQR